MNAKKKTNKSVRKNNIGTTLREDTQGLSEWFLSVRKNQQLKEQKEKQDI